MSKSAKQANAAPDYAPASRYVFVRQTGSIGLAPTLGGGVLVEIRGRDERGKTILVEAQVDRLIR